MSRKHALSVVGIYLLAISSIPECGDAATATGAFSVSVTVQSGCLASLSSTRFGSDNQTIKNADSLISVTCTQPTAYSVDLSGSLAATGSVGKRNMILPGFSASGFAPIPGIGVILNRLHSMGVDTMPGNGNGAVQTTPVVAQILPGRVVEDSSSDDTIMISVTY
ncbi:MAG: spore coat protein U domain-containing protein [Terracidiphilus sp.]